MARTVRTVAPDCRLPDQAGGLESDLARAAAGFSRRQVRNALALIHDGRITETARPGEYRAVGSDGKTVYYITRRGCNCIAGNHGRPCYHSAAARLLRVARRRGLAA